LRKIAPQAGARVNGADCVFSASRRKSPGRLVRGSCGPKDALQFLMTREITHMKAFALALESMGKPAFSIGRVSPTPGLVNQYFNESTGAGDHGDALTHVNVLWDYSAAFPTPPSSWKVDLPSLSAQGLLDPPPQYTI